MDKLNVLNSVRVASPCQVPWDSMSGDERLRFCGLCRKNVYNLSAMRAEEVVELIERTEGNFCGRFYRRADGTMLTADCPVAARASFRSRLRRLAACAVTGLVFLIAAPLIRSSQAGGPLEMRWTPPPSGPGTTLSDWSNWVLEVLGIRQRPIAVMGDVCLEPIPAPTSSVPVPGASTSAPTGDEATR